MQNVVISTWNCFGMGQNAIDVIFGRRAPVGARLRHSGVISECSSNDIFCVQELLSTEACAFFDGLKERFQSAIRDHNRPHFRTATMRGTGLGIGTRLSLLAHNFFRFSGRAVGWDRFARKGALHARLARGGDRELDVLTVHLQAGRSRAAAETRGAQLGELRRFIDEHGSPDRPFVICGDLNIDGLGKMRESGEYERMLRALDGFEDLGAKDDLPTVDPQTTFFSEPDPREQRLDYIFYRPARRPEADLKLRSMRRMLDRPLAPAPVAPAFASDHFGLIAEFAELTELNKVSQGDAQ
jgi:endonuclease/exonuclease/phosphatase family metal-dependent hydrolase